MTVTHSAEETRREHFTDEAPVAAPLSPEVEWYLESRGIKLPPHVAPLWRTPEPRDNPGAWFDAERVDKALKAMEQLRHTQGKWAGTPLRPDPWQVAYIFAPIFGWVHKDSSGETVRIIRSAWIEVPRKNGKTTIAAGIGLILAFGDGEPGAQVYAAAASKDQAQQAYRPAKLLAEGTPSFKRAGIKAGVKQIMRARDQSFMMAIASVGDLIQGTNPNGAIVDELHVHKSADVIDALESGTGARAQPLILIITTADGGDDLTVYATRRKEIEDLCKGTISSASKYGVVFGARKDDDPFAEETWAKANPGYPISPTREFMQTEAENAKNSPLQLTRFQRLNLNIRTKTESKFVTMDVWDRNAGEISDEREFLGAECYGGIDLASVSDLSAVCWLFPQDDGTFAALWRIWTPEANLERLDKLTNGAASLWVEDGWLETTPGNVTDYDYIETQIVRDVEAFDVMTIGYDPYNANQLVTRLRDKHGVQMVKVRQGFLSLSQPLKQTQRLLLKGTSEEPYLRHGDNPVMRWMTDNLAVEVDAAGNVKPSKKEGMHNGHKIDGWSALVNAMSEAIASGLLDEDDGEMDII